MGTLTLARHRGARYAVIPYKVKIEKLREKDDSRRIRPLDNFDGNGADLLVLYSAFLLGFPGGKLVERDDQHFGEVDEIARLGRTVRARWVSGQSGVRSHLKDDHEGTEFDRKQTAVERLRFMTLLAAPSDARLGVFLVEQIGRKSLSWKMRREFEAAFKRKYPGYALRIAAVSRTDLWAKAEAAGLGAEVSAITVVHQSISANELAEIGVGADEKIVGQFTQTYDMKKSPQRGGILRKARTKLTKGIVAAEGPDEVQLESMEGFDVQQAELVDGVAEISAVVSLPGENPVLVKYTGARPPQVKYYFRNVPEGVELTSLQFYTESTSHAIALLRDGGVRLDPGWDTEQWEHPVGVAALEVCASDSSASD
ncbi:hypothetical protein [Rhodococcus chondri]|uniref:Uncharacterized protein n=1 Tax=Rhodococcus chondri TaxID=3065941 RepID=A0ABU7JVC9_9NOCA|nr:hypothetical protein [Rhodococcus sp. CC-R104]MEE2033977.1 hypothetical protein [Rhodococcus sp. CC-R104]